MAGPRSRTHSLYGPSWLAAEIAITGAAAASLIGSGSKDRGGEPLGPDTDYGSLLIEIRKRPDAKWWRELHSRYDDNLSRRTWALALLATATADAVAHNASLLDEVLASLPAQEFSAFAASSSRIAQNGSTRTLPHELLGAPQCPRTHLVLAHFQFPRTQPAHLPTLTDEDLIELAFDEPAAWPVAEEIAIRMTESPSKELLPALARLGVDSISSVGTTKEVLDRSIAEAILDEAGRYPSEWVLRAEASTAPVGAPVLEVVALDGKWVPRVPRL